MWSLYVDNDENKQFRVTGGKDMRVPETLLQTGRLGREDSTKLRGLRVFIGFSEMLRHQKGVPIEVSKFEMISISFGCGRS